MKERWTWMSAPLIGRFSFRGGGGGRPISGTAFQAFQTERFTSTSESLVSLFLVCSRLSDESEHD